MNQQQLEQQYNNSLAALNEANQHGLPGPDYMKAVANLKASYQAQLQQSAEQGDPFVQGLTGNAQKQGGNQATSISTGNPTLAGVIHPMNGLGPSANISKFPPLTYNNNKDINKDIVPLHPTTQYTPEQTKAIISEYYRRHPENSMQGLTSKLPSLKEADDIAKSLFYSQPIAPKDEPVTFTPKNTSIEWATPQKDQNIPVLPKRNVQTINDASTFVGSSSPAAFAGVCDAQNLLDYILENNVGCDTSITDLQRRKQNEIADVNNGKQLLSIADWGLSGSKAFQDSINDFGGPEGAEALPEFWAPDVVGRTLYNRFGPEPTLSGVNEGAMQSAIDRINTKYDKQLDYLKNSDLRYLVHGDKDVYDIIPNALGINTALGQKNTFCQIVKQNLDKISELEPQYGSQEENQKYKEAFLNYLDFVIQMNKDGKYITEMNKLLDAAGK